jgi:hypothetical protein
LVGGLRNLAGSIDNVGLRPLLENRCVRAAASASRRAGKPASTLSLLHPGNLVGATDESPVDEPVTPNVPA